MNLDEKNIYFIFTIGVKSIYLVYTFFNNINDENN